KELRARDERQEMRARSTISSQALPIDARNDSEPTHVSRPAFRGFRRLFVEPGVSRVVTFGEFRPMLAPQCANADRLRDSHRVKALVRIYEATYKQPLAAFFNSIQKEDPCSAPLQPLTETDLQRLEL